MKKTEYVQIEVLINSQTSRSCLIVNDIRVWGPKLYGGGDISEKYLVNKMDLYAAIEQDEEIELPTHTSDAAKPEPNPKQGDSVVVHEVMDDLKNRSNFGVSKYGTLLKTNNGRNALMDAYQEALDLCMYLKQALMELEGR